MHLVQRYGDRLFALAYRVLRDADGSRDAVQDALVLAWRDLPTLRDPDRFEQWLQRVLMNVCIAQVTRERRRVAPLEPLVDSASAHNHFAGVDDRDQIDRGFRRLKADERALLALRHYAGYEPAEIATLLGIPPGTVRSRLHHAHKQMRAALEAEARSAVVQGERA